MLATYGAQHCTLPLKCDGTRAETRFCLWAKRTSPFKSARASVRSTTGSRGLRISGSNAGYTMFRGSVKSTGYPLHWPVSPFTSPPVRHRVPSHFNWTGLLRELCKWMTQIAVRMLWNLTKANVREERRTNTRLSDKEDVPRLDLRSEDSVMAKLDMKLLLRL